MEVQQRVAVFRMPHAGADRGTFFLPEIGDEVMVGFLNGDPRRRTQHLVHLLSAVPESSLGYAEL